MKDRQNNGEARSDRAAGLTARPGKHRRVWQGRKAIEGEPRQDEAPAWFMLPPRELPSGDVLAYLSRCSSCGTQAVTRDRHREWKCPERAEFGSWPDLAGQDAGRAIHHAFCDPTAGHDCTGYHCYRCGIECGPDGHDFCSTDATPEGER